MTKVWKRTGAVAIYSRTRAALVALLAILVIGGSSLAVGIAIGNSGDSGGPPAAAAAAADAPAPEPDPVKAVARTDPAAERRKRSAAYRRGLREGRARGVAGSFARGRFEPGGAYFVRISQRGGKVAQATEIRPGQTYWLCDGNTRLCIRDGAQ